MQRLQLKRYGAAPFLVGIVRLGSAAYGAHGVDRPGRARGALPPVASEADVAAVVSATTVGEIRQAQIALRGAGLPIVHA